LLNGYGTTIFRGILQPYISRACDGGCGNPRETDALIWAVQLGYGMIALHRWNRLAER